MSVDVDPPIALELVNFYEDVGRSESYTEDELGNVTLTIAIRVLEGYVTEGHEIGDPVDEVRVRVYHLTPEQVEAEVASLCQARPWSEEIMERNYALAVLLGAIPEV